MINSVFSVFKKPRTPFQYTEHQFESHPQGLLFTGVLNATPQQQDGIEVPVQPEVAEEVNQQTVQQIDDDNLEIPNPTVEMPTKVDSTKLANSNEEDAKEMSTTDSLEDLQTDEQRRILDTVAQVRKCGLDSILALPQLVVCGDQSAGKSSVLEALTEIPFPRNDNLCTRFATEIILRRAPRDALTIKVIPDDQRPASEQAKIRAFEESITDFDELPDIMDMAMEAMGMDIDGNSKSSTAAFARDVLSIEIEGPHRPQLTLVDIPGLIANATKGVTDADVKMVAEITDRYIENRRTICLAVISATNDHANQPILTKVRKYDPQGDRTLGIITKPDRLSAGSGSEKSFISLAQNEDVFFRLGWHVLKNRSFEEGDSSLAERNIAEKTFFRTSNFKTLPEDSVGIVALRSRLSHLLFEHVKQELPKLRQDLEDALADTRAQIAILGQRRSTPEDCKAYLSQLSLEIYEISKDAVDGHYEGEYFHRAQEAFKDDAPLVSIKRIRAVVQRLNSEFSEHFRKNAHRYHIDVEESDGLWPYDPKSVESTGHWLDASPPIRMSKPDALKWVAHVLARTRGRELVGNYNPLLVGELFWEQACKWRVLASNHIQHVAAQCSDFLKTLLKDKCPKDVEGRLWEGIIHDALKERKARAEKELEALMEDVGGYPINYNHYYTESIKARRQRRQDLALAQTIKDANQSAAARSKEDQNDEDAKETFVLTTAMDVDKVVAAWNRTSSQHMESFSSEEALDCLLAIYKVLQKTFIANVMTQVIERHVVRGLEKIFSPVVVNGLSDAEVEGVASEPVFAKRERALLEDRVGKLKDGYEIFRGHMGSRQ